MKKFILVFLLSAFLMPIESEASHILGGDIQYKYVGDSTGVAGQYQIKVVIYREQTGVGLGNTANVSVVSSTCNINTSVTCTLAQPEFSAASLGAYDCIPQGTSGSFFSPMVNIYIGYVTLTQVCNDYKMYWQSCCRPAGITGITNSNGVGFYFEAELNNTQGYNSSPTFVSIPISYVCTGGYINYLQNAFEKDNDSIQYELVPAREFGGGGGVSVGYAAGYTFTNPIHTSALSPFTLDPQSGNITFMANTQETSVMAIRVNEYRFDSTYGFWEKVGSSNREIQVSVANACNAIVNAGVKLDQNAPGVTLRPDGKQQVDYNCLDSNVMLYFTLPVECISISPDGSDFRLTAPNGQPIPIDELMPFCNVNGETDSIQVKLFAPLSMNGEYFLYSKVGNDGNTLLNKCGKDMDEFDTIVLLVNDCVNLDLQLTNVNIIQDEKPHIFWKIDPATFPSYLFNNFRIWRSDDNGGTYNQVTSLTDSTIRDWEDNSLGAGDVDTRSHRYYVEAIINGLPQPPSNIVHSIWLRGDLTNPLSMPVVWNRYNAWNNPQYTVQFGKGIPGVPGEYVWEDYKVTSDTNLVVISPYGNDPGQFSIRTRTHVTDSNRFNYLQDTAYSNWIEYGTPVPPVPPIDSIVIPNVITANNDGLNDDFIIQGIMTYKTRRELTIMNRFGRIIYKNLAYDNAVPWRGQDKSGTKLSDGVYYYVLRVADNVNAIEATYTGDVTLLTQ
tara:strand:+ start:23703 stop:25880 length:2178 start_codon:yes stop_codon:yes gene_type:complete